MKELTSEDYQRASNLGMDDSEHENHTGQKPAVMWADELWSKIMGDADRTDYPNDAAAKLRHAYDRGRSDYW